eukprot:143719_1
MTTTIGDRVKLRNNNLKGTVQFIGEIKGKYGIWYGIELDKKKGETNGSLRNVSYFNTKRNKGIFVKQHAILNTIRRNHNAPRCSVGDTVKIKKFGCNATVRYIGNTDFKQGTWYGVELNKPKGKNNGTVNNRLYFECKYKHGAFVKAQSIVFKNGRQIKKRNANNDIILPQEDIRVTIADTVQLGDKCIGIIRFIGPVLGKTEIYYGIELNGTKGKNDGSVQGIYYFKCGKNKGIFVRKARIQKRINIIDSGAIRVMVGDRIRVESINCNGIVRYIGKPMGKKGIWYGVELDEAKGKNKGMVGDRTYFNCKDDCGIFVRARNISTDIDDMKQIEIVDNSVNSIAMEEIKECDFKAPDVSEYVLNYDHVKHGVQEFTDSIKVDEKKHNGTRLLKIFDKIKVDDSELALWAGYGGGKLFGSKSCARGRLKSVVDFAEGNASCSKHIRQKLRVITKLIVDKGKGKSGEYVHILLLLASHGNVCNVMKEVAIGNAYGLMTDKLDDFVKQQSLKQQINKVLRDYRVLLVEKLFHSFGMTNNTHYIAGFHNVLAKKIGVTPYNDPNISTPST